MGRHKATKVEPVEEVKVEADGWVEQVDIGEMANDVGQKIE